jgi:hypothetical protein
LIGEGGRGTEDGNEWRRSGGGAAAVFGGANPEEGRGEISGKLSAAFPITASAPPRKEQKQAGLVFNIWGQSGAGEPPTGGETAGGKSGGAPPEWGNPGRSHRYGGGKKRAKDEARMAGKTRMEPEPTAKGPARSAHPRLSGLWE